MRSAATLIAFVVTAFAVAPTTASADCPRDRSADAVALVKEGDQALPVDIDGAISKYAEALPLDPDDVTIAWKLARAYQRREDWEHVVSACEETERRATKAEGRATNADYVYLRGYALVILAMHGSRPWSDAKSALEATIRLDPRYVDAHADLGRVLVRMGDEPGAARHMTEAIRLAPNTLQLYAELGDVYRRLFFYPLAEQVLVASRAFGAPGDPARYSPEWVLGRVYREQGKANAALAAYEAAVAACITDHCAAHPEAPFYVGVAYASVIPPRKAEAIQNLHRFFVITCKGAAAARFADECSEAMEVATRLGGTL